MIVWTLWGHKMFVQALKDGFFLNPSPGMMSYANNSTLVKLITVLCCKCRMLQNPGSDINGRLWHNAPKHLNKDLIHLQSVSGCCTVFKVWLGNIWAGWALVPAHVELWHCYQRCDFSRLIQNSQFSDLKMWVMWIIQICCFREVWAAIEWRE